MSPAREAVILARGLGTRMRARGGQLDAAASSVADTGVKALIPIERRSSHAKQAVTRCRIPQ